MIKIIADTRIIAKSNERKVVSKKLLLLSILFLSFNVFPQTTSFSKKPLSKSLNKNYESQITVYLTEAKWNELFPNRYGKGELNQVKNGKDFYSFKSFLKAAQYFPGFISGNEVSQKRELAAFLANIAQETSGGWDEAPGGYFKWGLYFLKETSITKNDYADYSKKNYPPVKGKSYYGRGPKQLSWNYNYGQFSEAWFGTKDSLLRHPEWLEQNAVLSFASAIWFWMTPQFPKPSCHEIMTGKWKPTDADLQKGRKPGFGATVNVINGGVECGIGKDLDKTVYRYRYYLYFCKYFQVSPGENIECTNQTPFGQ